MIKKKSKIVFKIVLLLFVACMSKASMLKGPTGLTKQNEEAKSEAQQSLSFAIESKPKQFSAIKCLLLCIGDNKLITMVAQEIKFDLEFTDQLDVHIQKTSKMLDKQVTQKLFKQGTSLCLYLQPMNEKRSKNNRVKVQIKLVDTSSQAAVFEKEYTFTEKERICHAHQVSADLLPVLTGSKGVTMSSLAYCKQLAPQHKIICVSDYACLQEKVLVSTPSLNVAPCWHSKDPLLFYSQFTRTKARLMSVNFSGHHSIICSYDGLTMQPSFSKDGKKVALCMSGKRGNSEIYEYDQRLCHKLQKRVYVPLTNNGANNVSPTLLPDDNLIFCSDFETGYPQIYYLNKANKEVSRVTSGKGHCAAPCYNEKNNAIVYIRLVKGVFQLFSCSLEKNRCNEKQLTFDQRDKLDPTWSSCGRYVAFTLECINEKNGKKTPQIAALNCQSGKIRVLTHSKEPKSFAAWIDAPHYWAQKA